MPREPVRIFPFPEKTPFPHPPHEEHNSGYYWSGPNAPAPEPEPTPRKTKAKK